MMSLLQHLKLRPWWRVFVFQTVSTCDWWSGKALCRWQWRILVWVWVGHSVSLVGVHDRKLHWCQVVGVTVIWRRSVILMRISTMHVAHWVCSGSLHATVLIHQIIHWWDWSRAPDGCRCVHTSICERAGYWRWFCVTSDWRDWWWRRRSFSLLGCWRFIIVALLSLLLLPTLSTSVLKPDLKLKLNKNH